MRRFLNVYMSVVFILSIPFLARSEMYRPYPILFVHGTGADETTWDIARGYPSYTSGLGQYFNIVNNPYPGWDPEYKSYLEAFSFSQDGVGSIDPDPPYCGEGIEMKRWTRYVLDKYYGDGDTTDISDWINNPDARVIIIAYSAGGLATRQYIKIVGTVPLQHHITKFISVDCTHNGTDLVYVQWIIAEPLDLVLRICQPSWLVEEKIQLRDFLGKVIRTPISYDQCPLSSVVRDLKGQPVPSGMTFHCLECYYPYPDWPFITTWLVGVWWCVKVQLYSPPQVQFYSPLFLY